MSKQTALEWFKENLKEYSTPSLIEIDWDEFNQLFEQAKEMEKKDMIEFSQQVFRNRYNEVHQSLTKIATDTFNETYGGDK